MSNALEYQAEMASWEGQLPSGRQRYFDNLRSENLIPTGKQGRNGAVLLESDHYVHGLLGLPAARPSDAAVTVRKLDALLFQGSRPANLRLPNHRLGSVLQDTLDSVAIPLSRGELLSSASMAMIQSWELTLCLDPLFAQIKIDDGNGPKAYFFHFEALRLGPMRRLTILTGDVLLSVSKMLADTYIHRNAEAAVQFLDATKPALSETDQEKAGRILQDAPALSDDQTRSTESSYASRNLELSFS